MIHAPITASPIAATGGPLVGVHENVPQSQPRAARGMAMYDVIAFAGRDLRGDAAPGASSVNVVAINDAGVACGSEMTDASVMMPTIWSPNGLSRRLECGPHGGMALAINARGVAVGYEQARPGGAGRRAVAWINGELVVLPALNGTTSANDDTAAAINRDGLIGGRSGGGYVLWSGLGEGRLDVQAVSAGFSSFIGPNDNGVVCGRVGLPERGERQLLGAWSAGETSFREFPEVAGTFRYFVTAANQLDQVLVTGSDEKYDDLGWFAVVSGRRQVVVDRRRNGLRLIAHAINDAGVVVGQAELDSGRSFPFVWSSGEPIDLNRLIPYDADFTIFAATAINNNGAILAFADDPNGVEQQVLLTPVRRGNGSK
ncbi:MAG: hypothetical protein IT334_10485 [Thermomicrobiales bacterium]|nr:hypothetical protein [Thermomicrobiales bacterium]